MMERKKVLLISPVHPDPAGSGREKRAERWMRTLSEEFEVHLLVVGASSRTESGRNTDNVQTLGLHFSMLSKLLYLFSFLISLLGSATLRGTPLCFWVPLTGPQKKLLREAYSGMSFDKIVCFRLYLSEYASFIASMSGQDNVELDMDDLESDTWTKIAALHRKKISLRRNGQSAYKSPAQALTRAWKRWLFCKLTAFQFRVNERRACRLFRTIYVCSPDDQKLLQSRYAHPDIRIFLNQVFGQARPPRTTPINSDLMFTGSLGYYPNEEAIVWFIREVFPLLRREKKDIRLHVAGFSAPAHLEALFASTPGVLFYRNLASIETLYEQAAIAISPLHAGGGTKLKVIEAMWFGLPVVATSESARGLELEHKVHFLLADSVQDFVTGCLALLSDPALYRTIAENGNKWVGERYSCQ